MAKVGTGTFPKFLKRELFRAFDGIHKQWEPEWPIIFDKERSTDYYEEIASVTGLGMAQVKPEGDSVRYAQPRQGFVARATNVVWGKGLIVTFEMQRYGKYKEAFRWAKKLALSIHKARETVAANILNRGWNTSYTHYDGKTLFATDHPRRGDGGTYANTPPTGKTLNEAALEDALIDLAATREDDGTLMRLMAKTLVAPPRLEFEAARNLLGTERPGTANREISAINRLNKFPGGIAVMHYLTSSTAWFIRTDAEGATYFENMPDTFDQDVDFGTKDLKYDVMAIFSFLIWDARCLYGSPGI